MGKPLPGCQLQGRSSLSCSRQAAVLPFPWAVGAIRDTQLMASWTPRLKKAAKEERRCGASQCAVPALRQSHVTVKLSSHLFSSLGAQNFTRLEKMFSFHVLRVSFCWLLIPQISSVTFEIAIKSLPSVDNSRGAIGTKTVQRCCLS